MKNETPNKYRVWWEFLSGYAREKLTAPPSPFWDIPMDKLEDWQIQNISEYFNVPVPENLNLPENVRAVLSDKDKEYELLLKNHDKLLSALEDALTYLQRDYYAFPNEWERECVISSTKEAIEKAKAINLIK